MMDADGSNKTWIKTSVDGGWFFTVSASKTHIFFSKAGANIYRIPFDFENETHTRTALSGDTYEAEWVIDPLTATLLGHSGGTNYDPYEIKYEEVDDRLYITNGASATSVSDRGFRILRNPGATSPGVIEDFVVGNSWPVGIEIDRANNRIFFIDANQGSSDFLRILDLTSKTVTPVPTPGASQVNQALAYDAATNSVIFNKGPSGSRTISRVDLSTFDIDVLSNQGAPGSFTMWFSKMALASGGSGGGGGPQPVAHYQANGDAADAMGNHPGQWGNPSVGLNGTPSYGTGVDGQAWSFNGNGANGTGSFVMVPTLSNDVLGGASFSMSIWANPNGCPSGECQIASTSTHGVPEGWELRMHGTTTVFTYKLTNNQQVTVSTSIPFNAWTQVSVTYDANTRTAKIYRDGSLSQQRTDSYGVKVNTRSKLVFGENNNWVSSGGHGPFRGMVDEVCIFDVVLDDAQVAGLNQASGTCDVDGSSGPVDTDGDGVSDDQDAFPNDPNETTDSDADGVGDNGDAFPNDPNETADSDGDGVGDNSDAFPNDPNETVDSDGDGVGDNGDAFPNDPNETTDSDGDGVGDNGDAFPNDPDETADSDGDGVGDNGDAFPNDPNESSDADGDGVGDNADPDDDGNGLPDLKESVIPMLTALDGVCMEDTSSKSKKSDKSDKSGKSSKKSDKSSKKSGKSDKGGEDDLAKAIDRIERSLNPDLWTDASHPDSKHGHKIFDEEKKAVKELQDMIEETTDCDDVLQAAIDALVATDLMLVDVAISEVSCSSGKCEKDLAKAEEARADALAYVDEGREDKAIDELKYAWSKVKKHSSISNSIHVDQTFAFTAETDLQTAELPTEFALTGNYPNPFNPQTSITFSMPEAATVRLTVYDLLGRQVALLVDGNLSAGKHEVRFDATNLPSGQYLYRLTTPKGEFTKMMMLLK